MNAQIPAPVTDPTAAASKWLRIRVVDETKRDGNVNVTIPIGLVRFGLKMAETFSPTLKGVEIDWESLAALIDSGATGPLVHVEDEAEHRTVDVSVE